MQQLWPQILKTGGARLYSLVAGIAVLSLTAYWLGPAGRGEMAAALIWTNLFYICGFLSLNLVAVHELAGRSSPERLGALFGNLLLVATSVALLGWFIASVASAVRPEIFGSISSSVLVLSFAALPFFIWEQYGNALLICIGRLDVYNRAVIVSKTLTLAFIAVAAAIGLGIHAAVLATVVGQMWLATAGTSTVLRHVGRIHVDWAMLRHMIGSAAKLHPSTVGTYVAAYAGVLVVNRYLGNAPTGHFQLATQLVEVMLVLPYAANLVLYGRLGESGVERLWPAQRRILGGTVAAMLLQAGVAALLAPWLITLLAGREFLPAVAIFRWLLIGTITGTIGAVMTTQWIGRGMFLQLSAVNVATVAITLVLNFALVPVLGINGAIIASVSGYLTMGAANLVLAFRCEAQWRTREVNGRSQNRQAE